MRRAVLRLCRVVAASFRASLWKDVFDSFACCDLPSRGLFGRSFQCATVPQPVPSWTPADRRFRPRSGASSPDTDKIFAIVLRDSKPLHNQFHAWPQGPGPGNASSWLTSRRDSPPRRAANQHGHKSRWISSRHGVVGVALSLPGRRIGQRWEPTRAPRQGSKRNEGGPKRFALVLCASRPFRFESSALNPSGVRGTPPEKHCL